MHRRGLCAQAGEDEYGRPTFAALCERAAAGQARAHHASRTAHATRLQTQRTHPLFTRTQDPGWPLLPDSGLPDAASLCAAVGSLRDTLCIYTYRLPRGVASPGLLPLLAPYFNRGYPVEAYLLRHMQRAPFATRDAAVASAMLLPVAPYALRVGAFPGDGLTAVQARVAAAVEAVKAAQPALWAAHGACDHVVVSAHDKGGRIAQTADRALIDHAVLIVNTADTHGDENEWCECCVPMRTVHFHRETQGDLRELRCACVCVCAQGSLHARQGCCGHLQLLHRAACVGGRAARVPRARRGAGRGAAAAAHAARVVRRRRPRRRAPAPVRAPGGAPLAAAARRARAPIAKSIHARPPHLQVLPGALFACLLCAIAPAPASVQRVSHAQTCTLCLADAHATCCACACATSRQHVRGTQVQSPRLLEILLFGCVPVIMADTYDLPLSDVLDWRAFSVRVPQAQPEALQAALAAADYESLRAAACAVAPFFSYHATPAPGDAFYMTMLQLSRRLAAAPQREGCRARNGTMAALL